MVRTEGSKLLRASAAGSLGSLVALGAGLLLDLTMALLLGAGPNTDALFVALRIPLGIAVFFPPTAVQILVPTISRWFEEGDVRRANARTTSVLAATALASGGVALAGFLIAPAMVRFLAPGLATEGHVLAASLTRVVFLMIPAIATSEVLNAYRHANRSHGLASAVHGALGLTIVAILLISSDSAGVSIAAWAYVAGAAVQLAASFVLAYRTGFRFRAGPVRTDEMRQLGSRSLRPLAASGVQLGTRIGEQMVASFLAPGSITILALANRLVSAVGGTLFFRPVMTAFIAPMSRLHAGGDLEGLRKLLRNGLRAMLAVSLSLTALVALAGVPFIAGLYALGDFTPEQARLLGITVGVYAASLPTAALQRMLLGFTFARLDTTTYLRNTIYGGIANLALLGSLIVGWRPSPEILIVPIAFSLAQIVNVWHAAAVVRRQIGTALPTFGGEGRRILGTVAVAVAIMLPLRLVLVPDLAGPPLTLVLTGLVTAVAGVLVLGAGTFLWRRHNLSIDQSGQGEGLRESDPSAASTGPRDPIGD
jgi:putative peptidoglycan lipid II flippase